MKANKPILLYIPAVFIQELNKYLKENQPNFKYDIVYFYCVVHYILTQQMKIKNKNKNEYKNEYFQYISINKKFLISVTVSNINDYIKILKNGEFIISDNHYIIGEKSTGYRINPQYLKGIDTVEIKTDSKLFNKIIKDQRKKTAHINRLEPFLKQMRDEFMNVDIDYYNAEKWILKQPDEIKRNFYMISLGLLKDKRFRYFDRNKTNNRLDTNLTNLKRELKNFIIGNYVIIDLKNSQPFFLSMLLNTVIKQDNKIQDYNNYNTIPLCYQLSYNNIIKTFGIKRIQAVSKIHQNQKKSFLVNLKNFNDSVICGTLYDDFIKSYSENITRDDVKEIMFEVLFSKNEFFINYKKIIPYEKDKKIFSSVYPFIYESIKILKFKDNVLLPVFLQKIESYIFIDCIAKELVNAGIVPLTVHDSVIVKAEHQEKTIEIMNRIFIENFNVNPTFDIKHIHTSNPI